MSEIVVALLCGALVVFGAGVWLLLGSRNLLRLVLAVEVLAKGVTLALLAAGVHRGEMALIQSLIVTFIIVETVVAAVMLAIVVIAQRTNGTLDVRALARLKG